MILSTITHTVDALRVDYAKLSIVHPMQSSRLCKVRFNIPYK